MLKQDLNYEAVADELTKCADLSRQDDMNDSCYINWGPYEVRIMYGECRQRAMGALDFVSQAT